MPSRAYNSDDDDGNLPLHRAAVARKPQVAPPPPPPTWSVPRRSYPTGSSYHQTILGKALFEHGDCAMVVSASASSSSIQNSSLGPNLFRLIVSTSPQVLSLFSNLFFSSPATTLQFVNTLRLKAPSQELLNVISPLLTRTRYFGKSLRELNLEGPAINTLSAFSSSSSSSSPSSSLQLFSADCCSFTDEHCRMVTSSFPNLTQLNLRMCNLGDSTLKVFAESAHRLPYLTSFSISFNDQVTDDGIKATTDNSSNFPNLTSLHFEGCDLLTDASVEVLASTSLGNLQEVGFAGASGVTDESLRFLLKAGGGSNTITKLNLSGCGITNEGLKYFSPAVDAADSATGNCLAHLKELRLSSCYEISDKGIKSLAASPFLIANLTLLDVSFCQDITDEGVDCIISSLTNLKELFLNRCTKVTGDKKMEWKTSKPFLKLRC